MHDALHARFAERALPMPAAWGTDVVAFGPSAHDADAYYLIRRYRDLDRKGAFYRSDAWRDGPRESILT